MSKKTVDTTQFAPTGMSAYNQLIPQAAGSLSQYMQDPFKSTFFQQMLGMGSANIGQQGTTQMANLNRNAQAMGGGGANPYLQSLQAQQGRFNSGQQSSLFGNLLNQAGQARQWATGASAGFNPLQTGQTQQVSGVGSWLPQLIGAGLGVAGGIATGGMGSLAKGALSGTMGAMSAALSPMKSPFLGNQFGGGPMGQGAPNISGGMPGSGFPSMFGQS